MQELLEIPCSCLLFLCYFRQISRYGTDFLADFASHPRPRPLYRDLQVGSMEKCSLQCTNPSASSSRIPVPQAKVKGREMRGKPRYVPCIAAGSKAPFIE